MGSIELKLGFDAKTSRITIDGKPHGIPMDLDGIRKSVMRRTNRKRLLDSTSAKAGVWASMPKPPSDG